MFAALARACGSSEFELSLSDGADVAAALEAIRTRYPAVADFEGKLAFAVNMSYVGGDEGLAEGDTLALIPPVSGG